MSLLICPACKGLLDDSNIVAKINNAEIQVEVICDECDKEYFAVLTLAEMAKEDN